MSPVLVDDSVLLTLPFGGAVLQKIGVSRPEIDAILEDFRKVYMEDDEGGEQLSSLDLFRRRLPPSTPCDIDDVDPEEDINIHDKKSTTHNEEENQKKNENMINNFGSNGNNLFVSNLSVNQTVVNDDLVQQALKFWYDND